MEMPAQSVLDTQQSHTDGSMTTEGAKAKLSAQFDASSGASVTPPLSTFTSPALVPQSPFAECATLPHVVQVSQICNRAM